MASRVGESPRSKLDKGHEEHTEQLAKKDLLTLEEVQRIADCATSIRDKAFIWVYFESMRRLGEILSLKIGNVEFDDLGARLLVHGKVGQANARVITSARLLATWLDIHPLRNNPDAPVWVTLNSREEHKQMTYGAIYQMLKDCVKRAGISKKFWPYLMRHSRITPASKVLSYSLLCSTAGWKQGSKMPAVYIHLAGEDIDEAQCILNGIDKGLKDRCDRPVSNDRKNISNLLYGQSYLGEMFRVYYECYKVLKPGKFMVVVVKDIRRKGLCIPIAADTIKLCQLAGFELFDIIINRLYFASFWQVNLAIKDQEKGVMHPLKTHEYVLVFQKPKT